MACDANTTTGAIPTTPSTSISITNGVVRFDATMTRLGWSCASRWRSSKSSHTRNASARINAWLTAPRKAGSEPNPLGLKTRPVSARSTASGTNTPSRARSTRYRRMSSNVDMNLSRVTVDGDRRAGRNTRHSALHPHHTRDSKLTRDDRPVRQHPSPLDDKPRDEEKRRGPPGVGLLGDEDVAALEPRRLGDVAQHCRTPG